MGRVMEWGISGARVPRFDKNRKSSFSKTSVFGKMADVNKPYFGA